MSQNVAPLPVKDQSQAIVSQFTPEQLQLIKNTIAKNATNDELKLFLYRCTNLGLDPLKPGQIHFIKYGNNPGTVVVGIDGFRARASRTNQLTGIKRGVLRDDKGKCVGGWAEVSRKGWEYSARAEVSLTEYTTSRGSWLNMPETMIQKVAEAHALRMAFPDDLGGLYTGEELDREASMPPVIAPESPPLDSGLIEGNEYRIKGGKWAKRSLEEIYRDKGPEEMRGYIVWLEENAAKTGKPLSEGAQEFIVEASRFLAFIENSAPTTEEEAF